MAIRFFFVRDKQIVQMPVNPPQLIVESKGANESTEVVQLGEITLLRNKALETINVDGFLPADKNAPYVLTDMRFEKPQFYINFFEKVRKDKAPIRFLVSDTEINMLMSIENFEYGLREGDPDVYYSLKLKEYREYTAKKVTIPKPKPAEKPKAEKSAPERPKTGFAVGDTVVVNGRYYYSSWGVQPSYVFKNFTGKISHIVGVKGRAFPYHITTLSGGYRGWVKKDQIRHK